METKHIWNGKEMRGGSLRPSYEGWKRPFSDLPDSKEALFETFLWGMETLNLVMPLVICIRCLRPSYEGWKLYIIMNINHFTSSFETFLWGMETYPLLLSTTFVYRFETFLWGMETKYGYHSIAICLFRLRPSYEGWKPFPDASSRSPRKCLRPSYEGWKPPSQARVSLF